jgi:hypothetical protein
MLKNQPQAMMLELQLIALLSILDAIGLLLELKLGIKFGISKPRILQSLDKETSKLKERKISKKDHQRRLRLINSIK